MDRPRNTDDLDFGNNLVRQARAHLRAQAREKYAYLRQEHGPALVARARLCCLALEAEEVWIPRIVGDPNMQGN